MLVYPRVIEPMFSWFMNQDKNHCEESQEGANDIPVLFGKTRCEVCSLEVAGKIVVFIASAYSKLNSVYIDVATYHKLPKIRIWQAFLPRSLIALLPFWKHAPFHSRAHGLCTLFYFWSVSRVISWPSGLTLGGVVWWNELSIHRPRKEKPIRWREASIWTCRSRAHHFSSLLSFVTERFCLVGSCWFDYCPTLSGWDTGCFFDSQKTSRVQHGPIDVRDVTCLLRKTIG